MPNNTAIISVGMNVDSHAPAIAPAVVASSRNIPPDIGDPLLYISRGGPAGGGDDAHQRRPDGIIDIDLEDQGQERDDHDAAAQTGERPQQTGHQRRYKKDSCK
jgi:hypothetical protein